MARTIMIQGTASGVGKSLLGTALCRLLEQEGFRVVIEGAGSPAEPNLQDAEMVKMDVADLPDLYWEEDEADSTGELQAGADVPRDLTVAAVRLPHLAHFTDVALLQAEPDVAVRWIDRPEQLQGADMVLIPGSKNPLHDLRWLRERGLADAIVAYSQGKGATVGVCGGYQMLGARLENPCGLEDAPCVMEGLGLLPVVTRLEPGNRTTLTAAEGLTGLLGAWSRGQRLAGYEVHGGTADLLPGGRPAFRVVSRNGREAQDTDGCTVQGGWTFGTRLHGLFDNDRFRRSYLNALRARRGHAPLEPGAPVAVLRERNYNRLAQALRDHLDLTRLLG